MKKFLLGILGALTLLCINQNAFAQTNYQEGYVVNTKNDTIPGLINYRAWDTAPKNIKFKKSADAEVQKFSVNDLSAFFVANEHYISQEVEIDRTSREVNNLNFGDKPKVEKERLFLHVYFRGKANLYYHYDESQNSHFFIEMDDVPTTELLYQFSKIESDGKKVVKKNTRYKGQLLYYMRACKNLTSTINRLTYTRKAMVMLFQKYNECQGGESTVIQDVKQTKLEKFAVLGTSYTNIDMPNTTIIDNTSFGASLRPTLGIGLNLVFARKAQKFSVYNDLLIRSYATDGTRERTTVSGTQSYDFNINFTYLKFSHMLRYYWRGEKVNVFVAGGLSNGFAIKAVQEYTTERSWNSIIDSGDIFEEGHRGHELGYTGGIGIQLDKFGLEMRYERGNGFRDTGLEGILGVKTGTLMFLAGYRF